MQGDRTDALVQGNEQGSSVRVADDHFRREGGECIPIQERPETASGGATPRAPKDIDGRVGVEVGEVSGAGGGRTRVVTITVTNMWRGNGAEAARF